MRLAAFLTFLVGALALRTCPPQDGAFALCSTNVVYIIDTTVFMHPENVSVEFDWLRNNIIPGTAWSTNQQLAFMSYGTGNAQVNPMTGSLDRACTMLDTLQNSYESQGSSEGATLLQALQIFKIVYQKSVVVLFSASQDANDIQQAGDFVSSNLQDSHFTVIAMNGADFSNFPARVVYGVDNLAYPPPNLPSCVIKQACESNLDFEANMSNHAHRTLSRFRTSSKGFKHSLKRPLKSRPSALSRCAHEVSEQWRNVADVSGDKLYGRIRNKTVASTRTSAPDAMRCLLALVALVACAFADSTDFTDGNIFGATDAPIEFTTVLPTTTTQKATTPSVKPTTTTTPTTTQRPIVTSPAGPTAAPSLGPQCSCDYSKSWNDVIFLIDASEAAGNQGLDQMWGAAQTVLDWFNVQTVGYAASNYSTRAGIITYGNTANIVYPLGTVTNDDIENRDTLPYNGDKNTNLEKAIQTAVDQFNGPNHRANSKKVIVIMAATYNPAGVTAPQQVADTFKEDDGIIIAINYVEQDGFPTAIFQEIASPGYFFSTQTSGDKDYQDAICDANCFCPINYASFSSSPRKTPTAGCYYTSNIQANQRIATNKCKLFNSGFLAFSEVSAKTKFLSSLFVSPSQFYIGATYDAVDHAWEWADGSPVTDANWANGATPNGANSQTCVYINNDPSLTWIPTDCRNGYNYACEAPACDSVHYCP